VSAPAEFPRRPGSPDLPGWFGPLLHVARTARAEDISAFVPPPGHHRRSAVLLLFGEGPAGPDVLLTERAVGLRAHPGQVAFPGGRIESSDAGPGAAAVREAQEETGLDAKSIDTCMKLGAGHPMGPLALLDLVGLDVSKAIGEMISTEIPAKVDEKIAAGELGRKTGSGMYPPRA